LVLRHEKIGTQKSQQNRHPVFTGRALAGWYARCLEPGVLCIKPYRLLPLLADPEHLHRFFILLLAFAAALVFWLETTSTPPTVSQVPSRTWNPAVARVAPATCPLPAVVVSRDQVLPSAVVSRAEVPSPAMAPENQGNVTFSNHYRLEKQNDAARGDWLQFIYQKLGPDNRTATGLHLEAGYGQLCRMESAFEQRPLEQPRCAYLRAGFSF
jgi:hypothetical protein